MTSAARRERAEQVIRDVHKELPDVWLGGRQRYVLVEAIANALAEAERDARKDLADVVEGVRALDRMCAAHKIQDLDAHAVIARLLTQLAPEGE